MISQVKQTKLTRQLSRREVISGSATTAAKFFFLRGPACSKPMLIVVALVVYVLFMGGFALPQRKPLKAGTTGADGGRSGRSVVVRRGRWCINTSEGVVDGVLDGF